MLAEALLPPTSSPLDSGSAQGNLIEPLNWLQALGIWPVGDFRVTPGAPLLTYAACTVALAAAAYGFSRAWGRTWGLVLLGAGALVGAGALIVAGSPWVEGKALATASPAFVALGVAGAILLRRTDRRLLGDAAVAVIAAGVIWSRACSHTARSISLRATSSPSSRRSARRSAGEGPR